MQEKPLKLLERITVALEAQAAIPPAEDLDVTAPAYVFEAGAGTLTPVHHVNAPALDLLLGIDRVKKTLLDNTHRFAHGYSANNALLWGARGMGKSTLVKAVHAHLTDTTLDTALCLVEIHREDISHLPTLLSVLRDDPRNFIIYCDDLSFNSPDKDFKALKSVLEGGLEGRPDNVIFYATSNRRHLLPRRMMDQEQATGINPTEAMDESIALSDRFGLWLGFHACDQAAYLAMIEGYAHHFGLGLYEDWESAALEWCKTRGSRSGRVAWQYVTELAGQQGKRLSRFKR